MGDRHGHKKMVPSGKARYNEMGTALGEERGGTSQRKGSGRRIVLRYEKLAKEQDVPT